MPGAVVEAGLANAVVGLQEIAAAILRQVMLV
jgi:chemotaxis response regulator CheB